MDGIYNQAVGNAWSGHSEGFQTAHRDLSCYMPSNRDQFSQEPCRLLMAPPPAPCLFFNLSDSSHLQPRCGEHIPRNQWCFPAWKRHEGQHEPSYGHRSSCGEKQFDKNSNGLSTVTDQLASNLDLINTSTCSFSKPSAQIIPSISSTNSRSEAQRQINISFQPLSSLNDQKISDNIPSTSQNKGAAIKKKRESSSKQCISAKKKARNEDKWARNIRKRARSRGEGYVSVRGKAVPARSVRPVDCTKCKFACPLRITEEERQTLFQNYWALGSFQEKVGFISSCVNEFTPVRPVSGRRAFSRRYMLKISGREERVCKEFFVSTFDISESTIVTYLGKKRKGSEAVADLRGKQTPSNKTPESTVKVIREHILSQAGLKGRLFHPSNAEVKNVKVLYDHYRCECVQEGNKPASISVYRKIYSDMRGNKSLCPFEIPPNEVLMHKKTMKTKILIKENCAKSCKLKNTDIMSLSCSHDVQSDSMLNSMGKTLHSYSPITALESTLGSGKLEDGQLVNQQMSSKLQLSGLNVPQTVPREQIILPSVSSSQGIKNMMTVFPDGCHQNVILHSCANPSSTTYNRDNLGKLGNVLQHNHQSFNSTLGPSSSTSQGHFLQPLFSSESPTMPCSSSTSISLLPLVPPNLSAPGSVPGGVYKTLLYSSGIAPAVKRKQQRRFVKEKKPKKRARNEDLWSRNLRKRLRFKGEAYTSVRGKLVQAKSVQEIDCSGCKFKCSIRINQEQREKINSYYWGLDTYKKKIEFLVKYVKTYVPKRKMTGRRAYSRTYTLDVGDRLERVCKDFFTATLDVSESTIATALNKNRQGPSAIVDRRGKHEPVNKTTGETIQNIRDLIIYLTGKRPNKAECGSQFAPGPLNAHRLYQIYKYDCDMKGKRSASLGIFRNVLLKEFTAQSSKPKSIETCLDSTNQENLAQNLNSA